MQSAFEILSKSQSKPTFKRGSPRDVVMADIYSIYSSEKQVLLRKKYNWRLYIQYLKSNRIKHSRVAMETFKKSKVFAKELPIATIAIMLARNKVEALYKILSEANDIQGRGGDAWAYIISNRFL